METLYDFSISCFQLISISMLVICDRLSLIDALFCSYVLKNEKADVYRLPYLASSGPGFG